MILISPSLLTMQPGSEPITNGAVMIRGEEIVSVGPADRIIKDHPGHPLYQFVNAALMPGLINLHTHLELPRLFDRIGAKTFPDWVKNLVTALRAMSAHDYAVAAKNNIGTLIQTGTSTVGEISTHRVSPFLLKRSGLRSVVFREIISMNQKSFVPRLYSLFLLFRLNVLSRPAPGLFRTGLSPHAPYTVAESVLRRVKNIAKKKHFLLAMHVAESMEEIRLLRKENSGFDSLYHAFGWDRDWAPSAQSSFEYLFRIGFLGPDLVAVHAVQVTDDDIERIKKTQTSIAHCPRSNDELGVGRMPLKKFLDAGVIVGLGTDSLASSPTLNMWDEMRYAYRIHQEDGITTRDIFNCATTGGARALHMEKEIGTLEPGKKADLIAVGLPKKDTGDLYSDLLRETDSSIMTMVNGKIIWTYPGFTIHDK
jgi:aminodeoxyfutalosine deaminase